MDIFEMAATYLNSLAMDHPFLDGNKRTALASCLTFLYINVRQRRTV
jgi:death-on-curing protein